MSNTANDLARDVGLELGIIDATGELSADELNDLTKLSRHEHAMLRVSPKVCYWDEDDIPDEVYQPLKRYLASCAAKTFGKSVVDAGLDEAATRRARLRALAAAAAPRYTGSVVKAEYF